MHSLSILYESAMKADDKLYNYFNELIMAFVSGTNENESKQAIKKTTKSNAEIRERSERVKKMPYRVVKK